ncbi:Duf953 domain protein [Mycena sanguinolenta]|uniref:Duf953 domain protein n=1 Tax=Mycena sanguinolenta TaxID=230812 RepID=A0A8H6XAJ3_9AGAR|nr:Duf953 domain protein [Mycena sanguinolenta]
MVLNTTDCPFTEPVASLLERPEEFLIFYSDIVDGQMWCPDCRAVDDQVRKTFIDTSVTAVIVYVGNKPDWKAPENVFRGEPFKITSIPTIVKMREGKEVGRLVEKEISSKLAEFVLSDS